MSRTCPDYPLLDATNQYSILNTLHTTHAACSCANPISKRHSYLSIPIFPSVSLIHKPNAHSPPVSDVSPLSSMAESKGTGKAQVMPPTPLVDTGLPSDERRAQELDQYYTPSKKSALRLTDRDSALPAHMQLICWRLGMRRALVSLIDRDTQYYVAESTRTMDLHNPDYYEDENDGPLSLVGLIRLRC